MEYKIVFFISSVKISEPVIFIKCGVIIMLKPKPIKLGGIFLVTNPPSPTKINKRNGSMVYGIFKN